MYRRGRGILTPWFNCTWIEVWDPGARGVLTYPCYIVPLDFKAGLRRHLIYDDNTLVRFSHFNMQKFLKLLEGPIRPGVGKVCQGKLGLKPFAGNKLILRWPFGQRRKKTAYYLPHYGSYAPKACYSLKVRRFWPLNQLKEDWAGSLSLNSIDSKMEKLMQCHIWDTTIWLSDLTLGSTSSVRFFKMDWAKKSEMNDKEVVSTRTKPAFKFLDSLENWIPRSHPGEERCSKKYLCLWSCPQSQNLTKWKPHPTLRFVLRE